MQVCSFILSLSLWIILSFSPAIARTPKEGAATTLNCAVNPALNSQQAAYYEDCREKPCNPDAKWVSVCVCVC